MEGFLETDELQKELELAELVNTQMERSLRECCS